MTEKEIAELRRRFRPDKSNITHIRGCYVNENREIVAEFNQSVGLLSEEEAEKLLALFRRALSGAPGKNLLDISFTTQQVADGAEHRRLMALRDSALKDEEAVAALFRQIIEAGAMEGNYLILLARDTYDVPYRSKDGEDQKDAGNEVFPYILCALCPVKLTKSALGYYAHENTFYNRQLDWLVAPPELGFLFPAFDDRAANLYSALYYTRDITDSHPELVEALFQAQPPMPAALQKETFDALLSESLAEDCSMDVVQSVHQELCARIEAHKADKESEPLVLSRGELRGVLTSCGLDRERVDQFESAYEETFGSDTDLRPQNLVDVNRMEIHTGEVTIRVSPEYRDRVETRVIDGVKYILIRADEDVEVNGVSVRIS